MFKRCKKNVVDKIDLQAELKFYVDLPIWQQFEFAILLLNHLVKQKITNSLPNLYTDTTLKIIATMPVLEFQLRVASEKYSFQN